MTSLLLPAPLVGHQRPRVHSAPTFSTSAGGEAVALAASLGLFLDPWQQYVLEQSLGERPDGRWSAFQVGLLVPRQNGKGSILEARELAGLFLFGEKKITHSAHEAKTSKDHFERLESLLRDAGYGDDLITYRRSTTEVSILLKSTGCKIQFFTRTDHGGRGLGGDVVVLDEAYALTRDQMAALMPTMSARSMTGNPQMWYTSSAGFSNSDVLAGIKERGEKGGGNLAYFDWSAEPGSDIYRREAWAKANPGLGVRISEEFVAAEIADLGEENFGRERLGLWASTGGITVITPDAWKSVADPNARRTSPRAVFAIEAEPERDDATIAVSASTAADRTLVELVDPGQKFTINQARDRLILACKKLGAQATVVISSTSPAMSIVPTLEKAHITVKVLTAGHERAAAGAFLDAITDRSLVHTGRQYTLDKSVALGVKHETDAGWRWRDKPGTAPLRAATLAHYGWLNAPKTRQPSTLYAF